MTEAAFATSPRQAPPPQKSGPTRREIVALTAERVIADLSDRIRERLQCVVLEELNRIAPPSSGSGPEKRVALTRDQIITALELFQTGKVPRDYVLTRLGFASEAAR